jgi:hypothetical protein
MQGMDAMQGMDGVSAHLPGSFAGHMVPGSLFLLWVVFWIWELVRSQGADDQRAVERFLIVKLGKVVFPAVGIQLELARMGGLFSTSSWNNLGHATMYSAFVLAGLIDLAELRGRVPPGATHLALALACWVGGFLFLTHPNHGAMPTAVHLLLVAVFWSLGAAVALEGLGVSRAVMLWFRTGLLLLLGTWFVQISFLLYVFGPPTDGTGTERSFVFFAWHVLAITAALFGLRAAKRNP